MSYVHRRSATDIWWPNWHIVAETGKILNLLPLFPEHLAWLYITVLLAAVMRLSSEQWNKGGSNTYPSRSDSKYISQEIPFLSFSVRGCKQRVLRLFDKIKRWKELKVLLDKQKLKTISSSCPEDLPNQKLGYYWNKK